MAPPATSAAGAFETGWRFYAAFAAISIINLAAALDATSLSVALPVIAQELHGSAVEAFWSGTSFLLASTVFQLDWVAFSHVFHRRPVLLAALAFFTIGAILCAVSKSFTLMLIGRSIQGAGGGGIIALTQVLITDMVPLRARGKFYALVSIVWAIGSVSGPLVGGAFTQDASWRWIFYINLPIIALGFAGAIAYLRLHHKPMSLKEKMSEIDYIGSVIFVASTTSFLIPITWGGVMYSWSSWRTLVPLIVGFVGLVGFVFFEAKIATTTILPIALFRNYSTSICYFGSFIQGMILWSILYYLPLYFQGVKGYSPVIAGVAALPQTCTIVPCAIAVGIAAAVTGKYRWALWLGWVLTTTGCGLLYLLKVDSTIVEWIFLLLVSGVGIGLLFPSMALAIQASAPQENVAIAAALFTFFRAFGQTIGVAIGGVIFQNRMRVELGAFADLAAVATEYSLDAVALVETIKRLPPGASQTVHLKTAFANALRPVWAVMCGMSGLAMLASLCVKGYDLNQEHLTEQGFANGERGGEEHSEAGRDKVGSSTTTALPRVMPGVMPAVMPAVGQLNQREQGLN
ncbi:MAG: hypothetical protein M1839_002412 [Geoglossum umbratile]|nr:MAG: hypothetical protein M1839_002412 [Geoglossum umbratile]